MAMPGARYVARRHLKIALPGRRVGDVSPGDILDSPEEWSQFKILLRLGHIEAEELPRYRCYECERDFKDGPGLKRHNTRMHK
jgi:hypothetical protein